MMNSDEELFESADEREEEEDEDKRESNASSATPVATKKSSSTPKGTSPVSAMNNQETRIPDVRITRSSDSEADVDDLVEAVAASARVSTAVEDVVSAGEDGDEEGDDALADESSIISNAAATVVAAAAAAAMNSSGLDASTPNLETPTISPPASDAPTPPTPSPAITPPNTPAATIKSDSGWGSWKSWGAGLIATASQSVAKMSSEIGQGFGEMQNIVAEGDGEGTEAVAGDSTHQGAAKEEAKGEEEEGDAEETTAGKTEEKNNEEHSFLSFFSSAGKGIVDGGLNVLETVGKKTMKVINDTDPGLNKTKSIFSDRRGKMNLSQILRDAKKDREENEKREEQFVESQRTKFDYWFEEKQGLVYLEALEILSGDSEKELEKLIKESGGSKADLISIRDAFLKSRESEEEGGGEGGIADEGVATEKSDEDDFFDSVRSNVDHLGVQLSWSKVKEARIAADASIADVEEMTKKNNYNKTSAVSAEEEEKKGEPEKEEAVEKEEEASTTAASSSFDADFLGSCHRTSAMTLGDVVAKFVQFFHKANQMLLMTPSNGDVDEDAWKLDAVASRIEALYRVKTVFVAEIDRIASRFAQALTKLEVEAEAQARTDQIITAIFLEATHGTSFVEEAYNLSIPIVQKCYFDKTQVAS